MNVQYISFCAFWCIVWSASYASAGGKHSKNAPKTNTNSPPVTNPASESAPKSPRKFSANWQPLVGDDFKRVSRVRCGNEDGYHHQSIKIQAFFENGDIVTSDLKRITRDELIDEWAKVDLKNPLHDNCVHDEFNRPGKVRGIYYDGNFLLSAQNPQSKMTCYWRAKEAHVFLNSMPQLCDEHGCPMGTLQCGHQACKECFPLTDPLKCVSCLAGKIATGQLLTANEAI